jgi:hypothetical protein
MKVLLIVALVTATAIATPTTKPCQFVVNACAALAIAYECVF